MHVSACESICVSCGSALFSYSGLPLLMLTALSGKRNAHFPVPSQVYNVSSVTTVVVVSTVGTVGLADNLNLLNSVHVIRFCLKF